MILLRPNSLVFWSDYNKKTVLKIMWDEQYIHFQGKSVLLSDIAYLGQYSHMGPSRTSSFWSSSLYLVLKSDGKFIFVGDLVQYDKTNVFDNQSLAAKNMKLIMDELGLVLQKDTRVLKDIPISTRSLVLSVVVLFLVMAMIVVMGIVLYLN